MAEDKRNLLTDNTALTALLVTAGIGLVCVIYRIITACARILAHLRNFRNPLGNKSIHVVKTADECQRVVNTLKRHCDKYRVLGFDCEWVTVGGTRRPVALLQLSSQQGLCALFRLCCLQQIPRSLRELLEDEQVIKVGVAPQNDAHQLAYDFGVGVSSTLDLRFLAVFVGHKPEGLGKLAKSLLNVHLDKNWRLACSDWEAKVLTEEQLNYAANDALVAVRIFEQLSSKLLQELQGFLPRIKPQLSTIYAQLEPCFDVPFKEHSKGTASSGQKNGKCVMQVPHGDLICIIHPMRAQLYLDRNTPLPVVLKSQPLRDVLLLCPKCHQLINIFGLKLRTRRAESCDTPFAHVEGVVKFFRLAELRNNFE